MGTYRKGGTELNPESSWGRLMGARPDTVLPCGVLEVGRSILGDPAAIGALALAMTLTSRVRAPGPTWKPGTSQRCGRALRSPFELSNSRVFVRFLFP